MKHRNPVGDHACPESTGMGGLRPGMLLLPMTALLLAEGCAYYGQAIDGHLEIANSQRANEEVIDNESEAAALRARLGLVRELREFAEAELSLPSGRNYTTYADLGRDHVLWSVFAAPEFDLEPKRWRYPFVGKLSYRGYYNKEMAESAAVDLESEGFDVFVGEVDAYSTLGWFRDPVLNTFADYRETAFAELIFHELTHRRVYLRGETDYNEAMATAVAQEGVRRWLRESRTPADLAAYARELEQRRRLYGEVAFAREALKKLYEEREEAEEEEVRRRKAGIVADLATSYRRLYVNRRTEQPEEKSRTWRQLNNARLNAIATYHALVPCFEELLAEEGGDFERFFEEVKSKDTLKRIKDKASCRRAPLP